jgi:ketosteroid isomerase-like protein
MAEADFEGFIAMHRAALEAFNRKDLDGAVAELRDDFEWHAVSEDPETSVLHGPEEVKRFFEDFHGVFDEWHSEPLGYERLGPGTALAHHVLRGTSRGAGVPVEVDTWELWYFDPESLQPLRVRQFLSRDEAMQALES